MSALADSLAVGLWNASAWVLWVAAIVEVVRTPAARFARGWTTKLVRVIVILIFCGYLGGLFLPLGAAIVLAGLRRSQRLGQSSAPPTSERGPWFPQWTAGPEW